MTDIVRAGWIQRHSKSHHKSTDFGSVAHTFSCIPLCGSNREESFLEGGWKNVWVVLHRDSNLVFYKRQGDSEPKGSIFLKEVSKWFAVGQYTNGMPERPDIPPSSRVELLLAIPVKPSSKAKVIWFMFPNDKELNDWMTAIVSVLPPAPRKSEAPPVVPQAQSTAYAPMPYAGAAAPPAYANEPYRRRPGFDHPDYEPGYACRQPPSDYRQGYPCRQPPSDYRQGYSCRQPPSYGMPQPSYLQQSAYAQVPPPPPGYAGYPGQYPHQQPYYGGQGSTIIVKEKKSSGLGGIGEVALGVAGGALLAHGATSMMGGWGGGGWGGGGWGCGRWGSWSSLSSLSSFGSCGSFSSWGSFD